MSTNTVCRVCLVKYLKLYDVRNDLQKVYAKLLGQKYIKEGYPLSMCYICLSVLQKCHRFMETARVTNKYLKQWYIQHNELKEGKPIFSYSFSKLDLISMENENISSEYNVRMEEENSGPLCELTTNLDVQTKFETNNEIVSLHDDDNYDTQHKYNNMINIYDYLDIEKTEEQINTHLLLDINKSELNDVEQTHILPNSNIDVKTKRELETNIHIYSNFEANEIISTHDNDYNNTSVNVEKTDIDEKTDGNNSLNDSTYIDTEVDDYDGQIDPLSIDNVDIDTKSSLAIETDDDTNYLTIIQVVSLPDNDLVPPKKIVRHKAKPQHHISETSGETDANSETSNNITPLNTSETQPENMKQGKKLTKTALKCNRKKKETKCNKIVKQNSLQNKTKKIRNTVKNIKKIITLSLKKAITEKTEINKITTTASNTAVTSSLLNANRNKHKDWFKYCEVCNLKCLTEDVLANHMRFHDNCRPYVCDVCHCRFDRLSNLNRHKHLKHKIRITNQIKRALGKCNRNKKETAKLNKIVKKNCIQNKTKKIRNTHKNINNLDTLSLKTAITEKTEINKINTALSNTTVADSMLNANRIKRKDLYKYCEVCSLKCISKDVLAKHMRFHDNSRPHVCDVCHYRFEKLNHLDTHKALIHKIGTTKEYFCDICKYKTVIKTHMTNHIRIHTGEKPFSCNICGYKCTRKGNLKLHMRSHTGEKPFSCNICGYKCTRNDHLKLHLRVHAGEKPFCCNICGYKCGQKVHLKGHMISHTAEIPFSCDLCDIKFKRKNALIFHMKRTHIMKEKTCVQFARGKSETFKTEMAVDD